LNLSSQAIFKLKIYNYHFQVCPFQIGHLTPALWLTQINSSGGSSRALGIVALKRGKMGGESLTAKMLDGYYSVQSYLGLMSEPGQMFVQKSSLYFAKSDKTSEF
jgi:hypothetical protein